LRSPGYFPPKQQIFRFSTSRMNSHRRSGGPPALSQDTDDFAEEEVHLRSRQRDQEKLRMLFLEVLGRWYWIALGLIVGVLVANYKVSTIQKTYSATTTLLVKERTIGVMANSEAQEINMGSLEAMNTVAARILRMDLLERVAAREDIRSLPGLVPPKVERPNWLISALTGKGAPPPKIVEPVAPPSPEALAGMIGGWVNVSIRPGTRLLDITIRHPVPEITKAVADGIAREYIIEISSARTTGRSTSIDILEKQSDEARMSLQTARGSLAIYSRALGVHNALDAKELEVLALQRRYLPKHPRMVAALTELKNLKDQFLREYEVARQAPRERAYWDAANKDVPTSSPDSDEYFRSARQQLLGRIGVLEAEIESSTSVFNSMLTRIEEASVDQESTDTTAEISSFARVPGSPSGSSSSRTVVTGAFGGLAIGLLFALILGRIDNKYHTVAQIAGETQVPILASIADINLRHLTAAERDFKKHNENKPNYTEKWDPRLLFRPGVATTSFAEMYRILRASVSLLGPESKRKVTLFSSALPGEGKSLTSANFALAAAGQGRKTLLIDLDLRKPSLHKFFGYSREHKSHAGITECLASQSPLTSAIIRDTGVENFHLILSGSRAPNPGELLSAGRINAILEEACAIYDVVVLDTAPLLAVPDTRIVAPFADNVCLVCRAEYVPKGAVRHVLTTLEEDGTNISGIIFNGFLEKRRLIGENNSYGFYKTSRYGRAYRYGYGAYGAYGSDTKE
jgi:succinoglycan biosynthesis transport protein ExoP